MGEIPPVSGAFLSHREPLSYGWFIIIKGQLKGWFGGPYFEKHPYTKNMSRFVQKNVMVYIGVCTFPEIDVYPAVFLQRTTALKQENASKWRWSLGRKPWFWRATSRGGQDDAELCSFGRASWGRNSEMRTDCVECSKLGLCSGVCSGVPPFGLVLGIPPSVTPLSLRASLPGNRWLGDIVAYGAACAPNGSSPGGFWGYRPPTSLVPHNKSRSLWCDGGFNLLSNKPFFWPLLT